MTTRDEWLRRDAAGDDADLRLEVCPECRAGEHDDCSDDECACGCVSPEMPRDGE